MLSNRKVAWLITALVMITGTFLGSYVSFRQLRAPVIAEFRDNVEPVLNEMILLTQDMLSMYRLYATDNNESQNFIQRVIWNIGFLQEEMELVRWVDSASWILRQDVQELYQRSQSLELSESNAALMSRLYADLQEREMILHQAPYNAMVLAYNNRTFEGLGFLTHNRFFENIFPNHRRPQSFLF